MIKSHRTQHWNNDKLNGDAGVCAFSGICVCVAAAKMLCFNTASFLLEN